VSVEPAADRILEAARRLFADRGYSETSIQMLAEAAQVNRSLIFYYFNSKEELYRRVVEGMCQSIARDMAPDATMKAGVLERLSAWIRGLCAGLDGHPDLLRIMLREVVGPGHAVLPVQDYLESAEVPIRALVKEGIETGVFRRLDPDLTAISLLGMVLTFFRRRFANGQEFAPEAVAEHVLGLAIEGLRAHPDGS